MNAELVGTHTPRSPEWHALRSTGLGGSDIAAILGLSPWDSAFNLYHRRKGLIPDKVETPAMQWGTILEPAIREEFHRRHPELGLWLGGTYRNTERPWQLYNPDALVVEPSDVTNTGPWPVTRIYEGKTSNAFHHGFGESGSDDIPVHYRAQVMWGMDCLGVPLAHMAVLIGGSDYREYEIRYDENEARLLRDAAADFWRRLQEDDPPEPDWLPSTTHTLRQLHPDIDDVDVEVDPALAEEYLTSKTALDLAEQRHALAKNRLLAAIGDGRRAVCGGQRIATRQHSTKTWLDRGRLVADTGVDLAAYTVKQQGPPFLKANPNAAKAHQEAAA